MFYGKKINSYFFIIVLITAILTPCLCSAAQQKLNYYYESKDLLNIKDPIGDDKGTGYYQYPLDKRLKRGTFDIKNFRVYEEGEVIVFEIQMRNYIMKTWEDTGKSDDQGFVASPTRITSGSIRRIERSPDAKVKSTFVLT